MTKVTKSAHAHTSHTTTNVNYSIVGFADVTLASYFVMVHAIEPEKFELILNIFNDDIFRNWWNRTEQYRTGNNDARL